MYEYQATNADTSFCIAAIPVSIILANANRAVTIYMFYIDHMAIKTSVINPNIANTRIVIYWYPIIAGIFIPLICITMAAPIRHMAAGSRYTKSCIADTFTVVHAPCVYIVI